MPREKKVDSDYTDWKVEKGLGGASAGEPAQPETIMADSSDRRVINYVTDCIQSGLAYRNQFKTNWDEVVKQIECVKPANWSEKEDWQTQIYVPLQTKTSEVVFSRSHKLLFPRSFFAIGGVEESDKPIASDVVRLIQTVLSNGDFFSQNQSVISEAGDLGTSAIKFWVEGKKDIKFLWRSCYNWIVDPQARGDISRVKFWVDEYKKDISELVEEAKKPDSLYDKTAVQQLLDSLAVVPSDKLEQDLSVVRGIDGTSEIRIPKGMREVTLHEFWGKVPVPIKKKTKKGKSQILLDEGKSVFEDRVITVANQKTVLRNDPNPYGFIPVVFMRLKKRRYDFYGRGYIYNTLDLQNLMNTIINLGMDSLIINSLDILKINANMIQDADSIQYKPLATWFLKDVNAAQLMRGGASSNISAISDVLNGVSYIDQIHQDATGVSRHAQGAAPIAGQPSAETLGEYQNKIQMIEERFLGQLGVVEIEYVIPLLKKIYAIVSNKSLFSQKAIDGIVGMKEEPVITTQIDPMSGDIIEAPAIDMHTGLPQTNSVSILLQEDLVAREFDKNFVATGVTQIAENMEGIARIQKFMALVMADPEMRGYIKAEGLLKHIAHALQISDEASVIKTKDEMQAEQQQAQLQQLQQLQMAQGGGAGQPIPEGVV